jgi:peptidoglycan/LPS O-acetylase OafA/YrhL
VRGEGAPRDSPGGRTRTARKATPRRLDVALRVVQAVLGLWLLVAPVLLDGPQLFVALKDVFVGGLLLSITVASAATHAVRRYEGAVCVVLGAVLIVASVLMEFGAEPAAVARQWNQVVVGVLLVCVGAARTR